MARRKRSRLRSRRRSQPRRAVTANPRSKWKTVGTAATTAALAGAGGYLAGRRSLPVDNQVQKLQTIVQSMQQRLDKKEAVILKMIDYLESDQS